MHGQTSSIFPLREPGADVAPRNSASAQAQMRGTNCCCAQPCLHAPTCLRMGLLPFSYKFHCESFFEGFSFSPEQSGHREHKRREMTAILQACPEMFPFLLFFLRLQHFERSPFAAGLRVRVRDTHIQNAVGTSCPESSDKQVTSFIFSGGCFFIDILGGFWAWRSVHFLIGATVDEGFIPCC
jgi:hypothetical protein